MKKILFISSDASRSGAPLMLLSFLKWMKKNANIPFTILLQNGGELESEFKALAPVKYFTLGHMNIRNSLKAIIGPFHRIILKKDLLMDNIGLVYSNTAINGKVLQYLSCLNCPVLSHIHELEYAIRYYCNDTFNLVKRYTNSYIAVSCAVKDNLIMNHAIPEKLIHTIHNFIPFDSSIEFSKTSAKKIVTEELGIPVDSFIVGGCGYFRWIKGPDIFILLAKALHDFHPKRPVHFVWVGGDKNDLAFYELQFEINKLGLSNYIHFIGTKTDPQLYFSAFDVLAVVSREESFSLATLHAASVGTPTICFDKIGGPIEFIENDAGFIVPYLDIEKMAYKITELMNCPEIMLGRGLKAAQKARERYNINACAPHILACIENNLK